MKIVALQEAKSALDDCVDQAQTERVLVTRNGKPAALVIGLEGQDLETMVLGSDADFWAFIAERRKSPATLTADEVLARIDAASRKSA